MAETRLPLDVMLKQLPFRPVQADKMSVKHMLYSYEGAGSTEDAKPQNPTKCTRRTTTGSCRK